MWHGGTEERNGNTWRMKFYTILMFKETYPDTSTSVVCGVLAFLFISEKLLYPQQPFKDNKKNN